jgi:hypothetical protein
VQLKPVNRASATGFGAGAWLSISADSVLQFSTEKPSKIDIVVVVAPLKDNEASESASFKRAGIRMCKYSLNMLLSFEMLFKI